MIGINDASSEVSTVFGYSGHRRRWKEIESSETLSALLSLAGVKYEKCSRDPEVRWKHSHPAN